MSTRWRGACGGEGAPFHTRKRGPRWTIEQVKRIDKGAQRTREKREKRIKRVITSMAGQVRGEEWKSGVGYRDRDAELGGVAALAVLHRIAANVHELRPSTIQSLRSKQAAGFLE